jgi:hypothetical protein
MEQEHFLSGYCRTADQSRMVTVVTENGKYIEADCLYETCPYAANCTIAKSIQELTDS